jgi:hypothetical protein
MTETFLILLAAGVMLAAALSDPKQVTLHWLRLAGIIALAVGALAVFFFLRREPIPGVSAAYRQRQLGLILTVLALVLAQLAFVQSRLMGIGRICSTLAFLAGVMSGSGLLHELMIPRGTAVALPPKILSMALQTLSCAGVAAVIGLALMEMLLGHAYLTASRMTMRPFERLNVLLAAALALRILTATALALSLNAWKPREMLWGLHGLFIATRYFVGLLIPALFIYMTHDCIRRRATQSATGILYVAGVLLFIGEIVALHLLRETGLPF